MPANKDDFYKRAARYLAGTAKSLKVNSVVHVEDVDDIDFWRMLLAKYRPGRYKFYPATVNENGNLSTGCTQCLKYKDNLNQRFFICIDSDLRYLLGEDISVEKGILQTYTYSWENHYAFSSRLQVSFESHTGRNDFNFVAFLSNYSAIIYESLLFMLYQERKGLKDFGRDAFKRCISLQYQKDDELDNGSKLLRRLKMLLQNAVADWKDKTDFCLENEMEQYSRFGLQKENAYLYVRGHCLYNYLVSIGKKLCEGTGVDFEQNILKESLAYEEYQEISKIQNDICKLNEL